MLAPKVFVTQTVDKEPYNIDFVPVMIDGSEYYELKSKDFHYGYMTEALANKIFETRPGSKDRYVDSFSFETKVKDNQQYLKLKNRIILDLPSTIDEANAFSAFSFYGIKYAEDLKKEPIFIKSKIGFSLSGVSSEIEFIFPDNKLNCSGFNIHDVNKGLTTIEIDAPNGNIKSININRFTSPGNENGDVRLSVTFEKEWGELLINNSYIPTYPGESGYLRIKTGDQLSLVNGGINSDNQKDLDLLLLESSKSIVIHDSHLFFSQTEKYLKDRPFVGISGDGSIHLLYNDCYINGLVQNDQSLEVVAPNPKETYKRYSFFITNSTFKSPVVLSLIKDINSLMVSDTLIDNKGEETTLKGDIRILGSELTGDGKKNIVFQRGETYLTNVNIENEGKSDLILGNVSIKNSKLTNISDLHDSEIANAEVLNFTLKTKNPVANKIIFSFGPMMDHAQKGYDENKNREAFCSLKNTVVKLNETDFFHNNTSGPLHLLNSVVEGTTTIKTSRDEGSYSLTIDSSILNNAQIFLTREDNIGQDVATTISNSEISMFLRANGLKAVRNSIIANGDLNQIDEINDSVCESVSLDGKASKILNGYNSVDEKDKIDIGQAINDLEIL